MNDFDKAIGMHTNNNWMLELQDNNFGNIVHLKAKDLSEKHAFSLGHLWVYGTKEAFTDFCKLTNFSTIIVLHNDRVLCNGDNIEFLLDICEDNGLSEKNVDAVFSAFENNPPYLSIEGFEFFLVD